jgi:hypothetical protein
MPRPVLRPSPLLSSSIIFFFLDNFEGIAVNKKV